MLCMSLFINTNTILVKFMVVREISPLWPVASGGAGGARVPPPFDRSVNPISTMGGTLYPPSTICPPGFSDLATALPLPYILAGIKVKPLPS